MVVCEDCDNDCVVAAKAAGADDTLQRPFKLEAVIGKLSAGLNAPSGESKSISPRCGRMAVLSFDTRPGLVPTAVHSGTRGDAVSRCFKHSAQDRHRETWMIDVSVARYKNDI